MAPAANRTARLARGVAALLALAVLAASPAYAPAAPPPSREAVVLATDAKQPSVAVGVNGTVFVAMVRGGNVVVATSKDGGKAFGEPVVAIDAMGSAKAGRQRGPRIGVDGKGRVYVTAFLTFDEGERQKRYPRHDLYFTTSADGGASWTKPARVNEAEKKAPESLHSLAVSPGGAAFVAWLDLRDRKGKGQDLFAARLDGERVGTNRKIAEDVCECCAPGLAVDAAGNPFLAWREGGADEDKASREVYATRSTDGGQTFSKPTRVNRTDTKEDT